MPFTLTEADYQDIALAVAMGVQLLLAALGVGVCTVFVAQACEAPSRFDHTGDVPPPYFGPDDDSV